MMKKFKAFTLVELIVTIAIFGILMSGIMQMVTPITESTTSYRILNDQKNIENAISKYIGESVRYATNLAIIEGNASTNPAGAIREFAKRNPKDSSGNPLFANPNSPTAAEINKIEFICFDGISDYTFAGKTRHGRMIASVPGRTSTPADLTTGLSPTGSGAIYEVFGNDYYAQGDYYLSAELTTSGILKLSVDSNYFYNPGSSRYNSSAGNSTDTDYALRNKGAGNGNYIFKKFNSGAAVPATATVENSGTAASTRTGPHRIYFVYSKETATYIPTP